MTISSETKALSQKSSVSEPYSTIRLAHEESPSPPLDAGGMSIPFSPGPSIRDTYRVLFKHLRLITALVAGAMAALVAGVYILPEEYAADAKLLVKVGRENIPASTLTARNSQVVVSTTSLRKEDIMSEIEILRNRYLIRKVVDKIGVAFLNPAPAKPSGPIALIYYYIKRTGKVLFDGMRELFHNIGLLNKPPDFEKTVMQILKKLSVAQAGQSDVIEVSLNWHSPEIAQTALNELLSHYLDYHLEA
ncbi:MAG: hypothetical protein GF344_19690, partial [Chitinivibrionales bacterium]|nr:hypothetical protein [Chitinivibrionales bacterium]MBD3358843.1 hypothetical protein [Chitinivibrionales bacterium]